MRVVKLGAKEYGIRCDVNVLEWVEDTYGGIEELGKLLYGKCSYKTAKEVIAEMINEQNRFCGSAEVITPDEVGRECDLPGLTAALAVVAEEFTDCVSKKK